MKLKPGSELEELENSTFPKLLIRNYQKWGNGKVAMRKKESGLWTEYTWKDCYEKVKHFSLGLLNLGFEPGENVLILGDNDPHWIWAELGIQCAGGAMAAIFPDCLPHELKHIIRHSNSKFVVAQDQEQVDKLFEIREDVPLIKSIIYWNPKGMRHYEDPALISFDEVLKSGQEYDAKLPGVFEQNVAKVKPADLAMILCTSGTTGLPKGVMLSHQHLISWNQALLNINPVYETDEVTSFILPSWIVDQVFSFSQTLIKCQILNFPESRETVLENLRDVAPHVIAFPSGLWEDIASTIRGRMAGGLWLGRFIYKIFLPVGYRVADSACNGEKLNLFWRGVHGLAEFVIFRPLRDRHGFTRVRLPYTSGAVLNPDTIRFLHAIGIRLRQLFSLTEVGALSAHPVDEIDFNSVGRLLPGVCVRLSDENEILLPRDMAFIGYCEGPEATESAFENGWLRTGDAGYIDDNGFLFYIDRLQDVRQLADGTRFTPQYIGSWLKSSPFIKEAFVVLEEDKGVIGAIISLNFRNVAKWAEKMGIMYTTLTDLSQKPEVGGLLCAEVKRVNSMLPDKLRIGAFINLYKEFDSDEAEVTRTGKLARKFIADRYKELVEAMFSGKAELVTEAPVAYRDGRKVAVNIDLRVNYID